MREECMRGSSVILFAFTLRPTVEPDLLQSMQDFHRQLSRIRDESFVPIVVVRTCSDVAGDLSPLGPVLQWCAANDMPFVSTSASTGENVDRAFELCARVYLHVFARTEKVIRHKD